ncbi:hypothetical protein D3C80_1027260 [compost metagenome]
MITTNVIERPILYSTEMVLGILDERKTKTRRTKGLEYINNAPDRWVIKPSLELGKTNYTFEDIFGLEKFVPKCPYGKVGDILWVRETWNNWGAKEVPFVYRATDLRSCGHNWKPSIHMPKKAARIWLQITDLRVEHLHDISEHDAITEGIEIKKDCDGDIYKDYEAKTEVSDFGDTYYTNPVLSFKSLWVKINGKESWISNPWVWVIKFKVLSTTGKPESLEHA